MYMMHSNVRSSLDCEQMVNVVRRPAVAKSVRHVKVGPLNLRANRPSRYAILHAPPRIFFCTGNLAADMLSSLLFLSLPA